MSLISIQFFAFLALLLLIYYMVPAKWQWMVPPVFSIVFYLSYGVGQIILILSTILLTYGLGLSLNYVEEKFSALRSACKDREVRKAYKAECTKLKKRMMLAGLLLNFGIWVVFKFTSVFRFLRWVFRSILLSRLDTVSMYTEQNIRRREICLDIARLLCFFHILYRDRSVGMMLWGRLCLPDMHLTLIIWNRECSVWCGAASRSW